MKSDSLYVAQMLDSMEKIRAFTGGVSLETLRANQEKQSAVLMQLLLIGEVARRVSSAAQGDIIIPWPQIIGMRNRVVHEYYEIDLDNVWKIIADDLPQTRAALETYLSAHPFPAGN